MVDRHFFCVCEKVEMSALGRLGGVAGATLDGAVDDLALGALDVAGGHLRALVAQQRPDLGRR